MPDSPIDKVLQKGGGFVNHPNDNGGPTNRGITKSVLEWWRKRPVTIDEVRSLSEAEARQIYEARYFTGPGFDKVPSGVLQSHLVDFGVHSGPAVAIMNLQEILGVAVDGKLGPATLSALQSADLAKVNVALTKRHLMLLARIVKKDPK